MDCCQTPVQIELQLAVLVAAGFTMSLGHCAGMCGPIAAAHGLRQRAAGNRGARLARSLIWYHSGRLAAYVLIGSVFAGMSQIGIEISDAARGGVSIAAGLGMGVLVVGATGRFPSHWHAPAVLADRSSCYIGKLLGATTAVRQAGLGVANGLLPCGPVATVAFAAAGAAAAGAFWNAGLAMLAYGVGTIPVLAAIACGTSWASARTRARVSRIGSVLLFLISVQLVLRGAAAIGWIGHLAVREVVLW